MTIGIDNISFYTANFCLELKNLAIYNGSQVDKYIHGIGQEKMSIAGADEDVVTMGANACLPIIEDMQARGEDINAITSLLFATETGVDQSKSAGLYVHKLLNLSAHCRVVELKQACYSSTAALLMATSLVARQPQEKVLVVASDIARYDRASPGEATQGCGAVAMLISHNPRILTLEPETGVHTEEVMDFWRPNYRDNALVDGKYSTKVYLRSVRAAWQDFLHKSKLSFMDFDYFCYHLPFSRMAEKAHLHLANFNKHNLNKTALIEQVEASLIYNRIMGNSYTASMYIGLSSFLDHLKDLSGKRIGFFSYGSGSVGEFFTGKLVSGYEKMLHSRRHADMLDKRQSITFDEYQAMYEFRGATDGGHHTYPRQTTGAFRLAGIKDHKRQYEAS